MPEAADILNIAALKIGYKTGGYEKVVLRDLNASACRGELIAIIGKNGSGKSTLLRTITGLQPPLDGEIWYGGINILTHSRIELAQKVGYISTEPVRAGNMSVYDLVSLGRFPYTDWTGRINKENHRVIIDAIMKTGMMSFSSRYIAELSDGERQRAMIARILAQDTGLMIMDEPTAFLDIGSKYDILNLMHNLAKNAGKTIIFSTHDLQMAVSHSDKIWLLTDSDLIEGAPEDLMIQGDFDHIFDSSNVKYNSDHGIFTFSRDEKGIIYLEGEGILRHWTEKAVMRAGFAVSAKRTDPYIIIPSGDSKSWILVSDGSTKEFSSIYELVGKLAD